MFHKPFRVKSNNAMKGSDRKRWKSLLASTYPSLTSDDTSTLLPSKGDVTMSKVLTHKGIPVNVVIYDRNPVFFEIDNAIYPTIYTLWKYPNILPMFTTWPPVFTKLNNGADLMLPGVILDSNGTNKSKFDHKYLNLIAKHNPCAINLSDNRAPVAVGMAAMSGEDMYLSGYKGKCIVVLHTYTDQLWSVGDKSVPPDMGPPFNLSNKSVYSDDLEAINQNEVKTEAEIVNLTTDEITNTIEDLTVEVQSENSNSGQSFNSMDDLLNYCLLKALKSTAKNAEYPLLVSTFYASHLLPCVPKDQTLDIKRTSYKKLTKFLKIIQEKGLLETKELTKGVESIISVNFAHPEIRKFVFAENDNIVVEEHQTVIKVYEPPTIEELYLVSAAVLPLFKRYGYGKSSPLTAADLRKIITRYVKDNDLQRDSDVIMDPILTDILLNKHEWNSISSLKWDEIQSRCLKKMNPGYRITFIGKQPIIHRGQLDTIEITVAQRAANKKVTLVKNLEVFGIDPSVLAHTVQVGVAASTSVSPSVNHKDCSQVLIQGNQVAFLSKLLLDEYKIPRKYINGLEFAKGKKSLANVKKN